MFHIALLCLKRSYIKDSSMYMDVSVCCIGSRRCTTLKFSKKILGGG